MPVARHGKGQELGGCAERPNVGETPARPGLGVTPKQFSVPVSREAGSIRGPFRLGRRVEVLSGPAVGALLDASHQARIMRCQPSRLLARRIEVALKGPATPAVNGGGSPLEAWSMSKIDRKVPDHNVP